MAKIWLKVAKMAYSVTNGFTELYSQDPAQPKWGFEKHSLNKKLE